MKIYYSCIIILLILCSTVYPVNAQHTKVQKIQHVLDSIRIEYENAAKNKIPSLNVLIHTPSDYIFVSSNAPGETPVTENTYFRFASNTKNFTATSILNMQEDGWLDIKSKITDLIPGSTIPFIPDSPDFNIPYKDQITIEQLLNHSAGVYDIDNDSVPGLDGLTYVEYMTKKDSGFQFELNELVNQDALNQLSYFAPGQGFHYSNTGYTMLGEIIERVYTFRSGKRKYYADYLNDYITGSLTTAGPMEIFFPYLSSQISIPEPFVKGNIFMPGGTFLVLEKQNMSANVADGNGIGTMALLNKYIRSLMKGESVLTAKSVELMKNTVSEHNKTYGLGCFYVENLGYGHNGNIKGYLSQMFYDPLTDVSVIMMTNAVDYNHEMPGLLNGLYTLNNTGYAAREILDLPANKLTTLVK
ncbi:MAG: serine hydrolase domain-containing protein [Ignavibacteria bacterium]